MHGPRRLAKRHANEGACYARAPASSMYGAQDKAAARNAPYIKGRMVAVIANSRPESPCRSRACRVGGKVDAVSTKGQRVQFPRIEDGVP